MIFLDMAYDIMCIIYRYDLVCLERGQGGYGGNVGPQWDVVNPTSGSLGLDACFASGWYVCGRHVSC